MNSEQPTTMERKTSDQTAGTLAIRVQRFVVPVSVLFARQDSIYKSLPACDVYDKTRDAKTFVAGTPVIAHPPCRAWAKLAHFANPEPGEKELALWAVEKVRANGGVLEHPEMSRLWKAIPLPKPGARPDKWGGYTIAVDQRWWGHRANKMTWLYIVGTPQEEIPAHLVRYDPRTHCIKAHNKTTSRNAHKKRLPTSEREHTPVAFAEWLLQIARRSIGHNPKLNHGGE